MATLTFLNGVEANKSFTLDDNKPAIIGRKAGCDIVVKEAVISAQHARLERRDTTLVMDLLCHQGQPGVSPREILEQVLGLTGEEALLAAIRKTAAREMAQPS